jgi:hypothetical protein
MAAALARRAAQWLRLPRAAPGHRPLASGAPWRPGARGPLPPLASPSPTLGPAGGDGPAAPPSEYAVLLDRGIEALEGGDAAGAVPLLLQAAARDPQCPTAQYNLGAAHLLLRDAAAARAAFERAAALAPEAGAAPGARRPPPSSLPRAQTRW